MDEDSSAKFIGSLTKFLQSLCNGYVEFSRGVELVGHIYLNIDTGEKVDYILHERVCKNDENSVSFTSNSFHAQQPGDKKKAADKNKSKSSSRNNRSDDGGGDDDDDDDDNDIMIVDDGSDVLGSTNTGTEPPRKHGGFHSPGRGPAHRQGSMNPVPSMHRNRQSEASATVTSRDKHQGNINIGNVKLEQISNDELLSLASHVGEGSSQGSAMASQHGGPPRVKRSSSFGDTSGQPVWVKQEVPDDQGDTGWSQSRDGQSDTSNSGSDLYPVMMHQNPGYSSSSAFPPGFSGSRLGHSQPLPGMSGAVDMYGNPVAGTSHGMGGMDPAEAQSQITARQKQRQYNKQYWQRLKADPERYQRRIEYIREVNRNVRLRKKMRMSLNVTPQSGLGRSESAPFKDLKTDWHRADTK